MAAAMSQSLAALRVADASPVLPQRAQFLRGGRVASSKSVISAKAVPKRSSQVLRARPMTTNATLGREAVQKLLGNNENRPEEQWDAVRGVIDANNTMHPVFDFTRWDKHRDGIRHWRHLFTIFGSNVFRRALLPCVTVTAWAALIPLVDKIFGAYPNIPPTPFLLTSTVLGLLLVFRTNASYDRWWEARKLWALLLQRSRDFSRQCTNWIPDKEMKEKAARYSIVYPRVLKCHLRADSDFEAEVKDLLRPDEVQALMAAGHKPLHIIQCMTQIINKSGVNDFRLTQMDNNLTAFGDVLGACERILRCPIPPSYTRHTSRFIMVYLALLPLVLYKDLGVAMIPTIFFMAYAMIGIEEIGVQIEEPFHLLPLDMLCFVTTCDILELNNDAIKIIEGSEPDIYASAALRIRPSFEPEAIKA